MQNIPQCFVDKMKWDDGVRELKSYSVIPFLLYQQVKTKQDIARKNCRIMLLMTRVDPDGDGRPMAIRM